MSATAMSNANFITQVTKLADCVGQTRNVEAIHVYTWTIWKHSRAFEYDIAANKIMMIATTVYATEVGRTLQVDSINGTESLSRNQVRT